MNKFIGFAILGLALSVPAHAQRSMAGPAGPTGNGGGAGSPVGGSTGGAAAGFRTLPTVPRTQFQAIDVSGGDISFFPSSFMQFDKGIAEGESILAARQKTLAEVASEYRNAEKPKAKLNITQDAFGNIVVERR
jgi:hypothetical protein